MVAEQVPQAHPVVACAQGVSALVAEVASVQPVFMTNVEKAAALLALDDADRRLSELRLRVMAASSDLADADGARDIASWLASRTHAESAPLRADQKLAAALDRRWAQVATGMARGGVSMEQAREIVRGLEELPDRLGPEVIGKAEAMLVELAGTLSPSQLRRAARHILDHVAPEIAEAEAAKLLEQEEQRARIKNTLRSKRLGDGMTRTTIVHPDAQADRLHTYLEAYTSPRRHPDAVSGEEDKIPYPVRLGRAFGALLEHLDPHQLPQHGGDATTVMVTIGLDSLRAHLGTGVIVDANADAGDNLSASEVRRLACTAGIVPVVLGGKGEILDLGRTRRLFSRAQRRALQLKYRRCGTEGCTVPARWCEAHHDTPWSLGGKTDLNDGRLYCSHHHHRSHDPDYISEHLPNGDVRFTRRR